MRSTDRPETRPEGPVADLLASIALAPPQMHQRLTIWPMRRRVGGAAAPDYLSLSEALTTGACLLDEVGEDGVVPKVHLDNRGEKPVLVVFGEELLGAKQNRIANASFLVAPRTCVVIDVSCVEHGRWSRAEKTPFRAGEQIVSHAMRRKMHAKVAPSLATGGSFDADQREVWSEVAKRVRAAGAHAPSGAYQDYTNERRTALADMLESFRPIEEQIGFVAAIDDEVVGLEAVASPALLRALFSKLLRAYAIDAIETKSANGPTPSQRALERRIRFAAPEPFLYALARAQCRRARSLGVGDDLRLSGPGVSACALDAGGIVHLTGFAETAA